MTREEAIEVIKGEKKSLQENPVLIVNSVLYEAFDMAIKALEQEPKTGHWISRPHIYGVAFCSECGFELKINNTNYCPNCGAKMVATGK